MYHIEKQHVPKEFHDCMLAAIGHLEQQMQEGQLAWLRADIQPPFLEHLSFRLGNQLFFILLVYSDERIQFPGHVPGLLKISIERKGNACLMPMAKTTKGWVVERGGWGLVDAVSREQLDPFTCVSDEKIEMNDWEIHDYALQAVRNHLENNGYEVRSWQSYLNVYPALWFVGKSKKLEWVVLKAERYTTQALERPENWFEITNSRLMDGRNGHFVSVGLFNVEQIDSAGEVLDDIPMFPLWRGHAIGGYIHGLDPEDLRYNS